MAGKGEECGPAADRLPVVNRLDSVANGGGNPIAQAEGRQILFGQSAQRFQVDLVGVGSDRAFAFLAWLAPRT